MSQDPLFILVILSMAAVLIVLMIGIGGFGRGGEFNRKYANKLMRLRIFAQFLAVAIILFRFQIPKSRVRYHRFAPGIHFKSSTPLLFAARDATKNQSESRFKYLVASGFT